MAGISSKAANITPNKEKTFQGQRFDDDLGLNWVQFKWRNHDPQIGRFIEIDPLADKYVYNSTYAFSENKVTSFVELEGLEAAAIHMPSGTTQAQYNDINRGYNQSFTSGAIGVAVGAALVASIVVPGAAPVIASIVTPLVFGIPSPSVPTSIALMGVSETKGLTTVVSEEATASKQIVQTGAKVESNAAPNFLVDRGGQAFPVPKNSSGPVPVINKNGNVTGTAFTGGKSGANGNVTSVRVMNANSKNPEGYVKYYNDAQPKGGLNPYSGQTLPNTQNHFSLRWW